MVLTIAIARPEHRELLRDAVVGILAVALSLVAIGTLGANLLHLSAGYAVKSLALFAAGAGLMLLALPGSHRFARLGAANRVTIVRAALVALLAGLAGEQAARASAASAVVLASLAMMLDGVDGWLARRAGMASDFGARFDMETDAAFVAVLAFLVWHFGKAGVWVLLSGLMRYLFAAASALVPRLERPVPATARGKTIAVTQMLVLVIALAPGCTRPASDLLAGCGLLALIVSFSLDVVWRLRQSRPDAA